MITKAAVVIPKEINKNNLLLTNMIAITKPSNSKCLIPQGFSAVGDYLATN